MDTGKKAVHSKIIIIALVAGLVLSAILYFFYENVYLIKETELPKSIQEKILESNEVDFGSLVDGDWDGLVIIGPYLPADNAKEDFGINLNRLKNDSIKYGDGQLLFVFCKGDSIESYFYMKYPIQIDYEGSSRDVKIPRPEATFKVINDGEIKKLVKDNT